MKSVTETLKSPICVICGVLLVTDVELVVWRRHDCCCCLVKLFLGSVCRKAASELQRHWMVGHGRNKCGESIARSQWLSLLLLGSARLLAQLVSRETPRLALDGCLVPPVPVASPVKSQIV